MRSYWHARVTQHVQDSYLDVPLLKFPEDLRVYEHLLWESAANVVVELGTKHGGSALWFHDRLDAFARHGRIRDPIVISVDRRQKAARAALARVGASASSVKLIEGDVRDPQLPAVVADYIPDGATCFIVEDGCVDVEEMRADPTWPRGVLPAIDEFLASPEGEPFAVRRDLERYGMSCHVGGFLQRRPPSRGRRLFKGSSNVA